MILQKPFYADFIGPGAILGDLLDAGYTAMYPIGRVHLCVATTLEERTKAIQRRIAYSHRLAEIARVHEPRRRAVLIIEQMCEWVGEEKADLIPHDLMARLAGVLPKTMRTAWQQRAEHCQLKFLAPDRRVGK